MIQAIAISLCFVVSCIVLLRLLVGPIIWSVLMLLISLIALRLSVLLALIIRLLRVAFGLLISSRCLRLLWHTLMQLMNLLPSIVTLILQGAAFNHLKNH